MNESEYMKEARRLAEEYGDACSDRGAWEAEGEEGQAERCASIADTRLSALLSHIAKGEQARAVAYKPAGDPRELWNLPTHDIQTRLEIAAGSVAHWQAVAANMRKQRDELMATLAMEDEGFAAPLTVDASPTTAGQQAGGDGLAASDSTASYTARLRDTIVWLERVACNTDTDPRWVAAQELRRLPSAGDKQNLGRACGVQVVGHACKLDGSICESRPDRCSDCPAAGGRS